MEEACHVVHLNTRQGTRLKSCGSFLKQDPPICRYVRLLYVRVSTCPTRRREPCIYEMRRSARQDGARNFNATYLRET